MTYSRTSTKITTKLSTGKKNKTLLVVAISNNVLGLDRMGRMDGEVLWGPAECLLKSSGTHSNKYIYCGGEEVMGSVNKTDVTQW